MPEYDLTDRMTEQVGPIVETLQRRLQADLSDRDKLAVAVAINDALAAGARVAYGSVVANPVEAGIEVPASFSIAGLQAQNLWPFDD